MTGCAPTVAQALLPFPQYCNNITGLHENLAKGCCETVLPQLEMERAFLR
jgi:hypothetical protein